jgi:hypothetical protein
LIDRLYVGLLEADGENERFCEDPENKDEREPESEEERDSKPENEREGEDKAKDNSN